MVQIQITEKNRIHMKQVARQYLPGNLDTVESQRSVLQMILAVLPSADVCMRSAETDLWPKVSGRQMTMRDARRKTGNYLNRLAGITIVDNLQLEQKPTDMLQRAWIAMDSYSQVMNPQELTKLRGLQDNILMVLVQREGSAGAAPAGAPNRTMDFRRAAPAPQPRQSASAPSGEAASSSSSSGKLILVVALLAVVVFGALFGMRNVQVSKAEDAIDAIGNVTLESEGAIKSAEIAVEGLSDANRAKVSNLHVLEDAREEYDRLDQLVKDCVQAINDVGKVTLDSGDKVEAARRAYDTVAGEGLSEYVENEYKLLQTIEAEYSRIAVEDLYKRANALLEKRNYEAAQPMYEQIVKKFPGNDRMEGAKEKGTTCLIKMSDKCINYNELEEAMNLLKKAKMEFADNKECRDAIDRMEKRLEALRPITGRVIKKEIGWGANTLRISAGSKDLMVKVVSSADPKKYNIIFLRANENTEVSLEDGEYKIQFSSGEFWYSHEDGFGEKAVYKELDTKFLFGSGKSDSLRFENGVSAKTGTSVDIKADTFWNR